MKRAWILEVVNLLWMPNIVQFKLLLNLFRDMTLTDPMHRHDNRGPQEDPEEICNPKVNYFGDCSWPRQLTTLKILPPSGPPAGFTIQAGMF